MLRELFVQKRKPRTRHLMFPKQPQLSTSAEPCASAITRRQYTIDSRTSLHNKHLTLQGNNIQSNSTMKSPCQLYNEYNTLNTTDVNTVEYEYDSNAKQLLYMKMDNDEHKRRSVNDGDNNFKDNDVPNNYELTMKHINKPQYDTQQKEEQELNNNHTSHNENNSSTTEQHKSLSHHKLPRKQKRNKHQSDAHSLRSGHSNRLNTLQQYISTIETNKTEKNNITEEKTKQLNQLQMNVDLLNNKLKALNKEHKSNMKSNRTMLKENDMFAFAGDRASENSIYVNRNVTEYKKELALMKAQIHTLQNERNKYHNLYRA